MRAIIFLLASLFCITGARAQTPQRVRYDLIPLPPPMQFIDRILRPCSSGATPFVSAIAASDGDFDITTCTGRTVTVNGTPITPGAGLADPGSNGYVVRTALNTTIARTFSVSTPITITNASGVAGNTTLACPTCVNSAAALTSTALITGAGLQTAQTPAATATLAANGNISTPGEITVGSAGGVNGALDLFGSVSGTFTQTVANAAGTWQFTWPINDGAPGQFLQTDGGGIGSWQTVVSGGGTVTGTGTTNAITKWNNGAGGVLADSRVSDDGTDIIANSGAGKFRAGDTSAGTNGSFFEIDDTGKQIRLSADDNNTGSALVLAGGASPNVQLSNGTGVGVLQFFANGDQIFGNSTTSVQTNTSTPNLILTATNTSVQLAGGVTTLEPTATGVTDLGGAGSGFRQLFIDATITAGGTTGNQTINKSAGAVNFAALASSLTVTSNRATTNSIILATAATDDTTCYVKNVVAAAGSFVVRMAAACTAETRVNFWILNQ